MKNVFGVCVYVKTRGKNLGTAKECFRVQQYLPSTYTFKSYEYVSKLTLADIKKVIYAIIDSERRRSII